MQTSDCSRQLIVGLTVTIGVIAGLSFTALNGNFFAQGKATAGNRGIDARLQSSVSGMMTAPAASIEGIWIFPLVGRLSLHQNGTKVNGFFFYQKPRGMTANINGTFQDSTFTFTSYFTLDPNGRANPPTSGILRLRPDGRTLTGFFKDKATSAVMPAYLTRDDQVPKCSIDGEWTLPGIAQLNVRQTRSQVDGRIVLTAQPDFAAILAGTFENQQLKFIWYFSHDLQGRQNPQGDGLLEVAPDCSTMVGHFRDRSNPNDTPWVLIRPNQP